MCTKKTVFIIGVRNSNSEEYFVTQTKQQAQDRARDLVEDGFREHEIVCYEAFERRVRINCRQVVSSVNIC